MFKKAFISLSILLYTDISGAPKDNSIRNLIIISDVINQDDDVSPETFNKFFDNSIFTPGPTGDILRDVMREQCAPIFVSKNLFQRCYNFCMFAQDVVEQEVDYIESTYGTQPIETSYPKNNFASCLKQLTLFLLLQHAAAQNFIAASLKQKKSPQEIQDAALTYLKENELSMKDYEALSKKLDVHLYPQLHLLASNIFMFYNAFKEEDWNVYSTKNGNYFLVPKGYSEGDFSKQRLHKSDLEVTHLPLDVKLSAAELKFMGQLFVEDIDLLINGISNSHKKPLVAFMTGHGSLPEDKFSSGLSLKDFRDLVTALGRGNTYAFFYLTCHAGGTTTQAVWFNEHRKGEYAVVDGMYRAPFITIVAPATEIAFRRKSPFWLEEFEKNREEYFASWFLTKKIPPVIGLPRIKDFFSLITTSLPQALQNSLYAPLYTIYRDQRSVIIPQAALIKLPGTEWFAPQFFYEIVFEINKTKSAKALFEKKALMQPLLSNVITVSTPIVYAPLVINQNEDLRIIPLLSLDPSYATTKQHMTYLSQVVIGNSSYTSTNEQLWNLSFTNIGPCMIVPKSMSAGHKNEFQKICVIENVVDKERKRIATRFTISPQGTFYIDPATNQIMRMSNKKISESEDAQPYDYRPVRASKQAQDFFEKIQGTIDTFLKADKAAKNSSQTVAHKYRTMKVLDAMLKKRIAAENKNP